MTKHTAVACLIFTSFAMTSIPAAAQDLSSQLVGVWKTVSFSRKDVETGKSSQAMGERPTGVAHYTKDGHFVIFVTSEGRTNNAGLQTDEDRVALFKSMFSWAGKYKVEGGKIAHTVDVAWIQSWVGTTRTYGAEVADKKLTLTTPVFKNTVDGRDSVVVTVYERAE